MSAEEVPSLFERTSLPVIPKEAGRKIAQLEQEFVRTEVAHLRQQIPALRPLYAKRNALVASKELQEADFWPRVFSVGPEEIDEHILPTDAAVIGQCLKNLTVERFDVDENGNGGDPRSVRFIFDFATGEENPYFTNAQLVKDFYYRTKVTKTAKGKRKVWEGYVSTPVRINWKKDQDLTKGLLDLACDLYEAEQKDKSRNLTELPEYKKLESKIDELEAEGNALLGDEDEEDADDENTNSTGVSFFAWFGYRGNNVTAEESAQATKDELERWQKIEKGEKVDDDNDDDEEEEDDDDDDDDEFGLSWLQSVEVFPIGEQLTVALAEELWPNALKYYVESYDVADDFDDEIDIEELEGLEDLESDDDDDEEEADKRPAKKVKT